MLRRLGRSGASLDLRSDPLRGTAHASSHAALFGLVELDEVARGVANEGLVAGARKGQSGLAYLHAVGFDRRHRRVEIADLQGKVLPVRRNVAILRADVELVHSEPEPCTADREVGPADLREPEHLAVERTRGGHVVDLDVDVVHPDDRHGHQRMMPAPEPLRMMSPQEVLSSCVSGVWTLTVVLRESSHVKVDVGGGIRLFFDVVGSVLEPTDERLLDKPTLLLLHGGPGVDHSAFRPYFDRFADTHQVVYLDHRGQGRSDARHDPSGWNLDTWADDVVLFCAALGIQDPVVFGNSFGGMVAIHYAARHPDHPSRLVLSSTQARRDVATSAARFEELGGPEARATYERRHLHEDHSAEAWTDYVRVNMPLYNTRTSPFGPDRAWRNMRVNDHWQASRGFADLDLREDLGKITKPTLVVGGAQDPMTPEESLREIFDHLRDDLREIQIVDDCGHGHWRDQPEQSEAILRRFLAG